MEKENKIIFYTKLLSSIENKRDVKIFNNENFEETKKEILKIKKNQNIEIWGATNSEKHKNKEILLVKDHINFSGYNPLIGKQKKIKTNFPDMTNVYEQHKNAIITISRGKYFLEEDIYNYPTQYFCYFAIIARSLGIKKVRGFLVNQKINNLKKHIVAKN